MEQGYSHMHCVHCQHRYSFITARGLSLPTFNMELHATAILAQIDISESATNSKVLVGHFAMSLSHAQLATNHN